MPDKKNKVTDPALLAELNSTEEPKKNKVTDPALLAELNGGTPPSSPKKNNTQQPSAMSTPSGEPTVSPYFPVPASQAIPTPPHDHSNKMFNPLADANLPDEDQQTKNATEAAYKGVGQAIMENQDLLPPQEQEAIKTGNLLHVQNPVTSLTDPHGDPTATGMYAQSLLSKLEKQKRDALQNIQATDLPVDPSVQEQATKAIDDKIAEVKSSFGHQIGLQLFAKEIPQGPSAMSKQAADNAMSLVNKKQSEDARLKEINKSLSGSNASTHTFSAKAQLERERDQIEHKYEKERIDIKNQSHFDNTRIGVDYEALMGNPQAIQDKKRLEAGLPINPLNKLKYDISGAGVIDLGIKNAKANGQHTIVSNIATHAVSKEKIEKDNQAVFNQQRAKDIGEAMYEDQNPIQLALHAVIPKSAPTKDEIAEYGKRMGLTDEQIDKLDPKEIPTQSTLGGQFTKSFLNSAAPLYEFPFRAAALAGVADKDEVNAHFAPGWENERGLGSVFADNAPEAQSHGAMGIIGHVVEGVGGLAGLSAEADVIGGALKAGNIIRPLTNAAKAMAELEPVEYAAHVADKAADYGFKAAMFMQGYDDSYKNSYEVVGKGDTPADEAKRQAYALLNGIGTTAIFSISPKTGLIKNLLPETTAKDIVERLAKDGVRAFADKDLKAQVVNGIIESAKENGKQVSLAVASQVYTNIENIFASKTNNYSVSDNVKESAMSTAVAMLAPSLMHGFMHPEKQSPLNKQMAYEMGSDPAKYTGEISKLLGQGKMTEAEAKTANDAILKMQDVIKNVPQDDGVNNVPLTPEEKVNFAWADLQTKLLEDKKAGLPEGDARIKRIDESLKLANNQKQEILTKAGDRVDAVTEVVNQEVQAEPTPVEETEKNIPDNKESVIPLNSTGIGEPKNEQNEKESNGPSAEEHGQEQQASTVIHEEANGEKRDERKEGGLLEAEQPQAKSEAEKVNSQQEAETPPAEPVLENKPKRVRKTVKDIPKLEEKPVEDASTQSKEPEQEIHQPSSVEEHARVEQTRSEEAPTGTEGGDSHIGGEAKEEVKVAKLSKQAQAKADDMIGRYNAIHGKGYQAQQRTLDAVKKRIEGFSEKIKKYTKGTKEYKALLADNAADKALLAHITEKPPARSTLNQNKKGENVSARNKEREAIINSEPATVEEYVMQKLLAMSDNRPEDKFSKKSIGGNMATKEGTTERGAANQFVHENGKQDVDQWANELAKSAQAEGVPLRLDNPQDITNILYPLLTDFKSKGELQQHLSDIFEHRENQKRQAEENAQAEHMNAEKTGLAEEDINAKLTDDARYERDSAIEAIDESTLTDNDTDLISEFVDSITDDKGNLDLNHPNFEPWSDKVQELYSKLSEEGSRLFSSILDAEKQTQIEADHGTEKTSTGTEPKSSESEVAASRTGDGNRIKEERQTDSKRLSEAIKEKEEEIIRKKAEIKVQHDKLSSSLKELGKAKKSGDAEAIKTATENYNNALELVGKKEAALKTKETERQNLIDEHRDHTLSERYNRVADSISAYADKVKESSKGMVGTFPGISPHLTGKFIQLVADIVRKTGNLHVAIHEALRDFLKEHPEEKVSEKDIPEIEKHLSFLDEHREEAPVFTEKEKAKHLHEIAESYRMDIEEGMTRQEIVDEIMGSENITKAEKAKLVDYIDWHTSGREIHNSEVLRQPEHKSDYLHKYDLTNSNEQSRYMSGDTLQDVHGHDTQFDLDAKEKQLATNLVSDSANMVGLAKAHAGSDDVTIYGPSMLSDIKSLPDGNKGEGVKKLLAVTGLHNEIQAERTRLENEKPNATPERKIEIDNVLKHLTKMSAQTEILYRDITSNASNLLNAARANRIYRNTFFADLYADKILDEQTSRAKSAAEVALNETNISDKATTEGSFKTEKEAEATQKEIVEAKNKSEAGKSVSSDITGKKEKSEAKSQEKNKNLIDRVKNKFKKKREQGERKEVIEKSVAEKKAKEYLGNESIDDLFNKAKEQTKKPC